MQLDTNLNIIVPEERLINDIHMQSMIPFASDKVLIYYFAFDDVLAQGSIYSRYHILNGLGDIVKEDTFDFMPTFTPGSFVEHQVAEVIPYDANRYIVSGVNFLGPGTGKGFYLADTNLNVIDTFFLKPLFFTSGNYSGSFPRFPNLAALPTGSLIGAGQFNTGMNIFSIFTKHRSATRFNIDTSVVYGAKDNNDENHTSVATIHLLEYNEADNNVYYSSPTHMDMFGSCDGNYNYVQIICADTNLNTNWRVFIEHVPDSCATVTRISKPFNRDGVLVVGTAHNINYPLDTAHTSHFVYYIDSTGAPLAIVEANGVKLRERIKIYPNPANDVISIDDINAELKQILVYDAQGRSVIRKDVSGKVAVIDISDLPPGLYMVQALTEDNERLNTKVIKQ